MHAKIRLSAILLFDFCAYLLFDLCATSLATAATWVWASFCLWEEGRSDLPGGAHSVAELWGELLFISLSCLVFATLVAWVKFQIVRRIGRELRVEAQVARRCALGSALVHGALVFSPMLWPCYAHWVEHAAL